MEERTHKVEMSDIVLSTQVTPEHDVWCAPTSADKGWHWECVMGRWSNQIGTVIVTYDSGVFQDGPLGREDTVLVKECTHDRSKFDQSESKSIRFQMVDSVTERLVIDQTLTSYDGIPAMMAVEMPAVSDATKTRKYMVIVQ